VDSVEIVLLDCFFVSLQEGRFVRKPFFRSSHKCWYLKDKAGRFIRLDPDEETAFEIWRQMLAGRFTEGPKVRVKTLIRLYLEANEFRKGESRFAISWSYLNQFSAALGNKTVSNLQVNDVIAWANEKKPKVDCWSATTQRDAIRVIKGVFGWARDEGIIEKNPISRIKVPSARPRTITISKEQHAALVAAANPALRLYLIASRCGARPRQIREVTARHVTHDGTRWIFEDHKTRHKTNRPLVVYLPPCLQTLTRLLVRMHPTGPLFRNFKGKAWTKDSVGSAIVRCRERAKLPDTVIAYAYRHTFATQSLLNGVSLAEVAELLGHNDVRMVSQVYGHLDKHKGHMVEVAAKAYCQLMSDEILKK
jgi:integrase